MARCEHIFHETRVLLSAEEVDFSRNLLYKLLRRFVCRIFANPD